MRLVSSGLTVLLLLAAGTGSIPAQVVLDGKFGTKGALAGPNFNITPEVGAIRGNNLFHSFGQFDLKAGDVASFSGPAHLRNIMTRVTGGTPSSIDGTIHSGVAGANFFLINPSGVLFGPNAVVNVSGSFAVSTAHYLKLADGARFVAALDADDSVLSSAPVAAFGFLDGASGSIEVQGTMTAAPGSSLSVLGSAVSVAEGVRLEAINGLIHLAGVGAPGEVAFVSSLPSTLASVSSSKASLMPKGALQSAGGDNVVIRGGRLVVENAQVNASTSGGNIDISLSQGLEVINGGQITTGSSGSIKGGNIVINSPSIVVDGKDGAVPTRIAAETFSEDALGAGGNLLLRSDSLELGGGAEISVSTFGAADAGRLEINTGSLRLQGSDFAQFPTEITANAAPVSGISFGAGGQIVITANTMEMGNFSSISASTFGDANAGSIDITAGSLTLRDSSIATYSAGAGNGGDIRIQSDRLTLDGPFTAITAQATAAGNGGVLNFTVGSLRLLNDSAISASTFGDGQGGNIQITADSIVLDQATVQPDVTPGISASSNPSFFGGESAGKGGDVSLVAGSLTLNNGMQISTTTSTAGDGGNISITAGRIIMDNESSIQSASVASGRAGTISLQSSWDVMLAGKSSISTSALESSGGDIRVEAGDEIRLFNSRITAQAGPGGGGSVTLKAPSLIYLLNSTLTAQAVGDGGNLTIEPVFLILNNSSLISKSSSANGGNITIEADFFFQSSSVIDASAPFGLPGTVSVSAPEVDLSGSLIGLPSNLLGAETQLRPDCGVRLLGNVSSFTVLGRGGLPMAPGGFVPSGALPPLE